MANPLHALLLDTIHAAGGKLPFADFMHLALYTPDLGYYSSNHAVLGKEGDFTTAPELTPLFAQTLAQHCQPIIKQVESACVLEFGAGSGKLCIDLLKQLESLNALPEHYMILEVSGNMRLLQQQKIRSEIPHLMSRINWLDHWPTQSFNGIILANEVLDAMPVHRFKTDKNQLLESFVTLSEDGVLEEVYAPSHNEALIAHVRALNLDLEGYQSEVNLFIDDWITRCHQVLHTGAAVLIDYGFTQQEYYHPDRNMGTLMCHHKHRAHPNPLIHLGEQDITAHVDFSHLAARAHECGWRIAGFTTQASFLLANGLLDLVKSAQQNNRYHEQRHAMNCLTHPSEMGELFKVMVLNKGVESTHCHLIDMRHKL